MGLFILFPFFKDYTYYCYYDVKKNDIESLVKYINVGIYLMLESNLQSIYYAGFLKIFKLIMIGIFA